jgi:hypothetical protein
MTYGLKKTYKIDKHHRIIYSPVNQAYLIVRSDGKVMGVKNTLKEAREWSY